VESLDYRVIEFGDMVELWGLCDVAICRAGAITVAELEVLGVPAVLVPLPGAPHDHQSKNARALADAGGAIVLSDAQCTGDALAEALDIMTSLDTMEEMGRAVHTLAHPHAAEAIADVVLGIRSRE
jgi:UDP-N-acetylglucosamine--N-acetylmuramyl-(pentapeptide) pyrophosphoryl-undecaprenol N-acetylglucosamine transferase